VKINYTTKILEQTLINEHISILNCVSLGQGELMSSGSKGIPGVWKARTGKKGVETMMTELD